MPFIRSFFVLFAHNNALGSTMLQPRIKCRSRYVHAWKWRKKDEMTKIRETATETELLNQIWWSWCHSFLEKMFSYMQLKYVTIFIREVLKIDGSAFSGTPGICDLMHGNGYVTHLFPLNYLWTLRIISTFWAFFGRYCMLLCIYSMKT